jgi:hypothetical protein
MNGTLDYYQHSLSHKASRICPYFLRVKSQNSKSWNLSGFYLYPYFFSQFAEKTKQKYSYFPVFWEEYFFSLNRPGNFFWKFFDRIPAYQAHQGGMEIRDSHNGRGLKMDLPRGETPTLGHCAVVPPKALDEAGGGHTSPNQVLLALMLLHFEGEPRAEDSLKRNLFVSFIYIIVKN